VLGENKVWGLANGLGRVVDLFLQCGELIVEFWDVGEFVADKNLSRVL
jgi:hypothetical protein